MHEFELAKLDVSKDSRDIECWGRLKSTTPADPSDLGSAPALGVLAGGMDADEERKRKIEEGRRRLEKLRSKKQNAVHTASRPLPSPFATAARKPPAGFNLSETGRKSSQATPRPAVSGGAEPVRAAAPRPEHQKPPLPQHDAGGEHPPPAERAAVLAMADLKDPKAVDDHIQRLRELDKSFTPPVRAGKSLAQPPAGVEPSQEVSVGQSALSFLAEEEAPTQTAPAAPHAVEPPEPRAAHDTAPSAARDHEPAPQSVARPEQPDPAPAAGTEVPSATLAPSAPDVAIGAGVPSGYISTARTGAPHFGTGDLRQCESSKISRHAYSKPCVTVVVS